MGSVPRDYRCPLCGRTGRGGYIVDWLPLPLAICTEGDYACLWHHIVVLDGQGGRTTGQVYYLALERVFVNRFADLLPLDNTRITVLTFLFGELHQPFV